MLRIDLPISKSIANRVLIRQAVLSLPLREVDAEVDPDDVVLMRRALATDEPRVDVDNCGTAARFLTAYFAATPGMHRIIDGCERMHHRPIGPLVDALVGLGADIRYLGETGYLPLEVHGRALTGRVVMNDVISTQYISALLLVGIEVETNLSSPYIDMTRAIVRELPESIERDWSAAAFWLERHALGLCDEPFFPGLSDNSLQGDRVVRDLFRTRPRQIDFTSCPDLYPALAITYEQLGLPLDAILPEGLRYKESDRIRAIAEHRTYGDHRIAMALLAADLPCDDTECIRKSYPRFVQQLQNLS